ncbi:MAG: endonuclease/exonuclease/phosphatase family protein [Flavobacteriales bacterium]
MTLHRSRSREFVHATLLLVLATTLAFSPDAYLPMLARAFMLQWATGFAALAIIAAIRGRWWFTWSALMAALMVVAQVRVPEMRPSFGEGGGPSLRVAQMNVLQPNSEHTEVIRCAMASHADLISFQEVSPEWAEVLSVGLRGTYPYQHIEPRTDCYGIALFSRAPFTDVRTIVVGGSPFVEALVQVGERSVRVLAVHASSPTSYSHFKTRNAQLDVLAKSVAADDIPTVVVGDLNTVPWDRAYTRFCRRSGLTPRDGTDMRSWPSIGPVALIPLDHVLASVDVTTIATSTFHLPGSDHRGLLAELQLQAHAR